MNGFHATGKVRLASTRIASNLDCTRGVFENNGGYALQCDGAEVENIFFFRSVKHLDGAALSSMQVGTLCDDASSWMKAREHLVLDGFTYERIAGDSTLTSAPARIAWLDLQLPEHLSKEFRPQPWEQLIAVLRAMGHPNEARTVAVEKQKRLLKAGRIPFGARTLHRLYGVFVGYGYRPLRLLVAIGAVWIVPAALYWAAVNPDWFNAQARILVPATGRANAPNRDRLVYRDFDAFVYSADVLLPVIDFGYASEWKPVVRDGKGNPLIWGRLLRYLHWFQILAGWVAGLLLITVVRNLIKKD
jgi:hypothetical protein